MDIGQKDFGELFGVGAGYISEIESGKKEPSATLKQLFDRILTDHNSPTPSADAVKFQITSGKESEAMYREKFEEAQQKIISLLEEVSELRKKLSIREPEKKLRASKKEAS